MTNTSSERAGEAGRTLGEPHFEIMRHTLGLSRSGADYRNYFCANDDHSDMPLIRDLCAAGYMQDSRKINDGRDTIYQVTNTGRAALAAKDGR